MKTKGKILAIAALLLVHTVSAQTPIRVARYWGGRRAAVSYTFDDGLLEHYTLVRPQLNRLGLKATFCIIGSKVGGNQKGTPCMNWQQLREMAQEQHEVTSHGYRHQSVEKLTGEALRYEVQHNDTLISREVGAFPRTYFFPGNRKTAEALELCGKDRVGMRTRQISFGSKRDSLWSVRWLDGIVKRGEWGVTMTHGITTGYDAFPDPNVLWHHLERAASMQDSLWIATFHDVAAYIAERDAVRLDIRREGDVIKVMPSCPLDERIFQQPLTLEVDMPLREAWQDGSPLTLVRRDSLTLLDFHPCGGCVILKP